ncbi:hypothetical protein GCM10027055_06320 [Janibacter alkaliphilus]|uniref:Uncharacterized protein YbjQ (UPF0145 family) n=1 Tax=Janibacter alkaliphilus TaxID=1069963 RepID=A0A852X461_9MICO|nr:heavy metal-binding domain-containing protein [Janibacter alkaliphilus]NYG37247.1 uncharacterized protein YbjQ (UPF0145 family) [Janibacter alkaliphilus]
MSGDTVAGVVVGLLCLAPFLLLPTALLGYSVIVGFRRRRRVQEQLAGEEPRLGHLLGPNVEAPGHPGGTTLVTGTVAYAADFPSRWATSWRTLVGGSAVSLTEQVDLSRRLAVVRMLQEAERMGATSVANVRLETSEIGGGTQQSGRQGAMVVEMLAYGTALLPVASPRAGR